MAAISISELHFIIIIENVYLQNCIDFYRQYVQYLIINNLKRNRYLQKQASKGLCNSIYLFTDTFLVFT